MQTSTSTISGNTIAADNIDTADRWIARLFDAFEALPETPGMGHKREDLTDLFVLFWPVGNYLVIYRARRLSIEIVAVTQGSRDIRRSFAGDYPKHYCQQRPGHQLDPYVLTS